MQSLAKAEREAGSGDFHSEIGHRSAFWKLGVALKVDVGSAHVRPIFGTRYDICIVLYSVCMLMAVIVCE